MALILRSYSSPQSAVELVPASAGRRIRVLRLVASTEQAGTFTLLAAPGLPAESALTNALNLANLGTMDLHFGADGGIAAGSGQALGLTTTVANTKLHGLLLWYELVD